MLKMNEWNGGRQWRKTYNQTIEHKLRQVLNHIVHLSVQVIWSKHVPVLLADFLNGFEGPLNVALITALLQMRGKLWDQSWPVFLHESLGHQCDCLEEESREFVIWTSHKEWDQMLLQSCKAIAIDKIARIILIIGKLLRLFALARSLIVAWVRVLLNQIKRGVRWVIMIDWKHIFSQLLSERHTDLKFADQQFSKSLGCGARYLHHRPF